MPRTQLYSVKMRLEPVRGKTIGIHSPSGDRADLEMRLVVDFRGLPLARKYL